MNAGEMKLGVVGLDGHGVWFSEEVNGPAPKLPGARVVAAMPVPSVMIDGEGLCKNVEKVKALGVEIVESPEALAKDVDGILILHDDGSKHLELARLFVKTGKPLFVDKPIEASSKKAEALVRACEKAGCPLFSASSLRFSVELKAALAKPHGSIISAMTYSPFTPRPTMPGWIYYGIHAVEPLFALMGPGCEEVRCVQSPGGPCAIGVWPGGRIGIAKGTVGGEHGYGFTLWRDGGNSVGTVELDKLYPELLKEIKGFIETGKPAVAPEESVEVIRFMEAANKSMERNGGPVSLRRKHVTGKDE